MTIQGTRPGTAGEQWESPQLRKAAGFGRDEILQEGSLRCRHGRFNIGAIWAKNQFPLQRN